MNIIRTSNPVLREKSFKNESEAIIGDGNVMTLKGVINKTLILFGILLVAGIFSWKFTMSEYYIASQILLIVGSIGGFILAIVTSFVKKASPITAPIYAALEGVVLGSLSSMLEFELSGIVFQAIALTILVFGLMLFMYKTGILKASGKFIKGVFIVTAAIGIFYLVSFIASLFTSAIHDYLLFDHPWIGIIVSVVIVTVAALNLILDFNTIETSVNSNSPKYMEWYAGFGLMVTLVWLYIEILRLLSYLRRR